MLKRQTDKIRLFHLLLMGAGMFLSLAGGSYLLGQEEGSAPPILSKDQSTMPKQANSGAPVNQNPPPPPESLPKELGELLQQQARQNQASEVFFTPLRPIYRILLLTGAALIVLGALIVCRYLNSQAGIFAREINIFLLFGIFGGVAALFVACACVGSLYLHLAAAACTVLSGFSIAALLMPQFSLTRRWVVGPLPCNSAEGDK